MTEESRPIPAIGTCDICKKSDMRLYRTYFHYDLKCECHSPNHFDVVDHCEICVPVKPATTKAILKAENY